MRRPEFRREVPHDDLPMRGALHAGQGSHLRGAALRVPGHDAALLEVPSLWALALARPIYEPRGSRPSARNRGGKACRLVVGRVQLTRAIPLGWGGAGAII